MPVLENHGFCPICEKEAVFVAENEWFRDHYVCNGCMSIPRERALMQAIQTFYPNWKDLAVHECSPGNRGVSTRLLCQCANYIPSQYFPDQPLGAIHNGARCENLEALTFPDESFDLHITQDVMEHVFRPDRAFAEIARTLKPGGAHIATVPLVNKAQPSELRAVLGDDGKVVYLKPPSFHGNPISEEGSLVTMDWGFDICRYIFDACGLFSQLWYVDDLSKGIRAEYIEVLITFKPARGQFAQSPDANFRRGMTRRSPPT